MSPGRKTVFVLIEYPGEPEDKSADPLDGMCSSPTYAKSGSFATVTLSETCATRSSRRRTGNSGIPKLSQETIHFRDRCLSLGLDLLRSHPVLCVQVLNRTHTRALVR